MLKDVLKDMKSLCFLSCGGEATQGAISSIACPAAAFFRTEMCPLQNGQTDRRTDLLRILIHFHFIFVSSLYHGHVDMDILAFLASG